MTTKKPTIATLKDVYNNADANGKKLMISLYGETFFKEKQPKEKIQPKNFSEVCRAMRKKESDYAIPAKATNAKIADIYMKRLKLIAKYFNGDWVADLADTTQYKYWCWFEIIIDPKRKSGFGFAYANYAYVSTDAFCGSRPFFKSEKICLYVGKTFTSEFEAFQQHQQLADMEEK